MSLWSKSRSISKILIFKNFRLFKNRCFDEKSIAQEGIWIAGRPWSRWDPPGPKKEPKPSKTMKNLKIRKAGFLNLPRPWFFLTLLSH